MGRKSDLRFAHRDGYRVRAVESENRLSLYACLVARGKVIARRRVWQVQEDDSEQLYLHYPEWNRRKKLLAALLRAFNEGANMDEVGDLYLAAHKARDKFGAEIPHQVVAVDSEETHVRTFLLESGKYLRVIEDDTSEVMTPEEMQAIIEGEAEEPADPYT